MTPNWPLFIGLVTVGAAALVYRHRRQESRRQAGQALHEAAVEADGDFEEMLAELEDDDRVEVDD